MKILTLVASVGSVVETVFALLTTVVLSKSSGSCASSRKDGT